MKEELSKKSDALKWLTEEYLSLLEMVISLTYFVPPNLRNDAIKNVPRSFTKTDMLKRIDKIPYYEDVAANRLMRALMGKPALSHPEEPETKD